MISFNQLQQRVAAHFPDSHRVEDGVLRFVRKLKDRPFAVCYLALDPELPNDDDELARYQDRVVGSHYFEGSKSLQWSNYLYFITSAQRLGSQRVQRAKELIESNRSYARKFVISETAIDEVLTPPVAVPEGKAARPNVISLWTQALVSQGLLDAIISDEGMPSRLAKIESTEPTDSKVGTPAAPSKSQPPAFLRRLQLATYRPYPLNREFEFGTMNLIFGPNAAGKTSLLEAIELLYCGRNKRNDEKPSDYEIAARYGDGKTEKAHPGRPLQLFRDRNLNWYGQPEILTSYLYQSFSKFNFLDTDAAVRIAESTEEIDQDLSKLLIGPEASKIWDNIVRVHEALESRLRDFRKLGKQSSDELAELVKRLKAIASLKTESDSIEVKLKEMLQRFNWSLEDNGYDEKAAGKLVTTLAELTGAAEQAASFGWIKSPISRSSISKFISEANQTISEAARSIADLEMSINNQRRYEENIKRLTEVQALFGQLRLLVEAQVPARAAERVKCDRDVTSNAALLVGFDLALIADSGIAEEASSKDALAAKYEAVLRSKADAQATLKKTQNEYAHFSKLRTESISLAQQLRAIAARIMETNEKDDECPLCHTSFPKGGFAKHMSRGVDNHVEQTGQALLRRQRSEEAALKKIVAIEATYEWLVGFCDRADIAKNVTVVKVLERLDQVRHVLNLATQRRSVLDREIGTLARRGLSEETLQEVRSRLTALKRMVSPLTIEAIDEALKKAKAEMAALTRSLQAELKAGRDRGSSLQAMLSSENQSLPSLKASLSQFRDRVAISTRFEERLNKLLEEFPWGVRAPLADLVVSASAVSAVAGNLQKSLGQERQDRKVHADLEKRRKQLQAQTREHQAKLKRLQRASDTLSTLKEKHSLQDEMNAALLQNRKSIETIFSQIHAPDEFSGLSNKFPLLKRKNSDEDAKLTEISTGQRAAYALSIFLAQNSQLTSAPPVMLIDDPIAHVDDLNALSFLDYLREVALQGKRQIFFATANDKLATLIERKFDFLAGEFKKISLNRGV